MPANHKIPGGWTAELLCLPTAEILARLRAEGIEISASAVTAARRARGLAGGHGGRRAGSGRKPRA